MDPIAHTLAGACIAQTGLKKTTPLATATLMIGANLPDIDGVAQFVSRDASLLYRRGLTHGVLAMVILPAVLTGLVFAYDKMIRRKRNPQSQPVNVQALLLLSYLGVLSHPFLDWLNTYGVRLLMPFSGSWFYGDTLFIIDPWMWLLMGAAVVFAYSSNWISKSAWLLLGAAMSTLVFTHAAVPFAAKIVWALGLSLVFGLRARGISPGGTQRTAMVCLTAFFLYLAVLGVGNGQAREAASEYLALSSGKSVTDVMTGPLPANPLQRMVLVKTESHYQAFTVRLTGSPRVEALYEPVPLPEITPTIAAALKKDDIKGFVNWMRFPVYSVQEQTGGFLVTIRDLRYVTPDAAPHGGIGSAQVFVTADEVAADAANTL